MDNTKLFSDVDKAFNLMQMLVTSHFVISKAVGQIYIDTAKAMPHTLSNLNDDIIERQLFTRINDNIKNVSFLSKNIDIKVDDETITRYDYDLFVMELSEAIIDMIWLGIEECDLIFNKYAIELSNVLDNPQTEYANFKSDFAGLISQTNQITNLYASID